MSWEQYQSIIQENRDRRREDETARPVACPLDGSILVEGPNAVLNCPMGNFRWPA